MTLHATRLASARLIMILEALSVYDQWRDRDDAEAQRIYELLQEIAAEHGFQCASELVQQAE